MPTIHANHRLPVTIDCLEYRFTALQVQKVQEKQAIHFCEEEQGVYVHSCITNTEKLASGDLITYPG